MNFLKYWFRIYAPELFLRCCYDRIQFNEILREREQHDVGRLAKGYIIRVKSLFQAFDWSKEVTVDTSDQERVTALLNLTTFHWAELFELELLAIRLAPEALLNKLPAFAHYDEHVATTTVTDKVPDQANALPSNQDVRAGKLARTLFGQRRYLSALRSEQAIDRLRLHLCALTLLMVVPSLWFLHYKIAYPSTGALIFSGVFGILGAFASILLRIQDVGTNGVNDPAGPSVAMLMRGSWSLYLSLASGILFGILGFFIFAGHLGDQVFSPSLIPAMLDTKDLCDYTNYQHCFPTLKDGTAYARMAVWAFAFGFSERTIPDIVTKLSKSDAPKSK